MKLLRITAWAALLLAALFLIYSCESWATSVNPHYVDESGHDCGIYEWCVRK